MKIYKPVLKLLQRKYLVSLFLAGGVLLLSLVFSGWVRNIFWPSSSYRTEQGIAEKITPRVEGNYVVANSSSSQVQFASSVNVQVKNGDLQTVFSLASSTAVQPTISSDKSVVYEEVYPGVAIRYQAFPTRLKEDIIVKNKNARSDFTYDLQVPAGATLEADQKGGIRIERDKQLLFYVEPLKAADQSGHNFAYEYVLPQTEVLNKGGLSTVRLSLRPVNASELAKVNYPLTIDPTLDWSVISITPSSGSINGGTSVTLSGTNFSNNWAYRKKISIDEKKIPGTSGLNNFTVLISLTDANLKSVANGGHVGKSNGGDIKFTLADGITKLNHEIKKYDPATGQIIAWVNVPYVSATANTDLYMYFGNAAASDQWNASSTWSQYRSVWHMDDAASDTFAGTTLDTNKWTTMGVGSVSQNERLTLTTSNAQWAGAGVSSAGKQTFKGDFDIQFDFDASAWSTPASDGFDVEIELWSGSRVYIQTYHKWSNGSKAYGNWQTETNAGWGASPATSATTGKLRMVRVGSTITSYYWNGSSWAANGSYTGTYSGGEMYVNLVASNRSSGTALPATYVDNFVVNSGDTILDTTAKNNGLNSGSAYTAGKIGGAHYFNGTNSFISVPYSSTLDIAAGDFSVETWINSTQAQVANIWPTILSNEGADGNGKRTGYDLSNCGDTSVPQSYFTIYSNDAQYNAMGLNIRDGAWHHVVTTKTASQIKIYIDGVLVNTATHNLGSIASTRATQIGRYAGSNSGYFAGSIDELWINNNAVSDDWVAAEYANQNSPATFYNVGAEESPTQVSFGGVTATSTQLVSSTTITTVVPAHAAGAVDVVVVNSDGQAVTLTNGYTYIAPQPTISAVTPNSASKSGGDIITINGGNFYGTPTVYFGAATSSSVTFVSSSTLSVVVPASATVGSIDLKVVNPDGQYSTLTGGFTYQELPPTISGIAPNYGTAEGGTNVTITGSNFYTSDAGSGADGVASISTSTNINTNIVSANRTCADAVNYSLTALSANTATLDSAPGVGCLSAGDEILLINLQGTAANNVNVGNYETVQVKSVSENIVTFAYSKTKYYGNSITDDSNIGTSTSNQRVMLQRVPNYSNVNISTSTTLTASAWDGTKGGVLFFRANGIVTNNGVIDMTGKGYRGGTVGTNGLEKKGGYSVTGGGDGGNGTNVTACPGTSSNAGGNGAISGGGASGASRGTAGSNGAAGKGGGAGWCSWTNCGKGGNGGEGGGGGGSTDNYTGSNGGGGGSSYSPDKNSQSSASLLLGAGATQGAGGGGTGGNNGPACSGVNYGGGGGKANGLGGVLGSGPNGTGTTGTNGANGQNGGGIILIKAISLISGSGSFIQANGGSGGNGGTGANTIGGGGAGGSGGQGGLIFLSARQVNLNNNSVLAKGGNGGAGGNSWGAGGAGAAYTNGADLGSGGAGGAANTYNAGGGAGAGGKSGYGGLVNIQYADAYSGTTIPAATVQQSQFNESIRVLFGDVQATNINVVSSSTLTAVVPAHAAGSADVTVINSSGQSATLTNGYTYTNPPTISSVTPASALRSGGDTITINGNNFSGTPTVYFGAATSSSVTFVSSSTLSVVVPASATAGSVDLKVVNPDGQYSTLASGFTYQEIPPTISNISPNYGTAEGGTNVTITGSNFSVGAFGSGTDGSVSISVNKNINTDTIASGRSCADAVNYSVTALSATMATVNSDATGCLATGDEVLLTNLQGTASSTVNVGNYETLIVSNVSGSQITFTSSKNKFYGDKLNDDSNIGVATTNQKVMLQRVPNYIDVTISSGVTLTSSAWDGFKGGVLFFKVLGTINNSGTINTTGKGYRGGISSPGQGNQGESYGGVGVNGLVAANLGGGGAGFVSSSHVGSAGGGAYGTNGGCGQAGVSNTVASCDSNCGLGGIAYGTSTLAQINLGSGGGGGAYNVSGTNGYGGAGGGVIMIRARNFTNSGSLVSSGVGGNNGDNTTNRGSYTDSGEAGGGGSGGSILISGKVVSLGTSTITAAGGTGGTGHYMNLTKYAGSGGAGRLAVKYITSHSGTTSPSATLEQIVDSSSVVYFGGTLATDINVVSSSTIIAITPTHSAGSTDVTITNPDGQSATLTNSYTYVAPPSISSVTPASSIKSGGDTITIYGSNFSGTPTVYFGAATSSNVIVVSSSTLSVVVPPSLDAGVVDIKIVNPDGQYSTLASGFTYQEIPPTISNISPNYGVSGGGTSVTITGSNFKANSTIGTGGTITTSGPYTIHTFTSNGTFNLPQNRHVDVLAIGGGGNGGAGTGESDGGGSGGGSGYVVAGTYSVAGSVTVNVGTAGGASSFGSYLTAAAGASGLSGYSCPPYGGNGGSGGGAGTRQGYGGGGSGGSGGGNGNPSPAGGQCNGHAYSGGTGQGDYSSTLAIFGGLITAGSGGGNGGHSNGIGGTGYGAGGGGGARATFGDAGGGGGGLLVNGTGPVAGSGQTGTTCRTCPGSGGTGASGVVVIRYLTQDPADISFGGVLAANATIVNSTTITAITPAHSAGSTDVTITNPDGQSATLVNGFTFTPPPTISSVNPASAVKSGGDTVVITGSDYFGTPTVYFGGATSSSVIVVSSSTLSVVVPPSLDAGVVDIKIVNPDGQNATLTNGFTYLEGLPTISKITPNSGPIRGGTTATITGTNFVSGAAVSFGGISATSVVVASSSAITISTPAHNAGTVDVVVTNPDGHSVTLANAYTYLEAPQLSSITPNTALQNGYLSGAIIRGNYFQSGAAVVLRLANQADLACSNYQFIDSQTISCDFNFQGRSHGQYNLVLVNPDNQTATLEKAVSISKLAPSLNSLTPTHTLMSSSTVVQLSGDNLDAFYKVPVTINSSSTLSNYQIKLTVDTASLISAGKMRSDGGDIRFYDADNNPLAYWLQGPINNSTTKIWVTIPSLAAGNNTIYFTYGNLSLTADNSTGSETTLATSTSVSLGTESGASRIYFGGVEATNFKVISSSTISVVSPVHNPGPVDVTLTNLDGQSSTLVKGFSYFSDRYVITTPVLNLREGQSGLVSIQSQDINGNAVVVATDTVFTLSSNAASGFFARDLNEEAATRWNYNSVVIPVGQSGVSFYYKDNQKGSPILTITPPANESAPQVRQTEKITSRFRLLVAGVSSPIKAGSPSSVTIQAIDYNGQPLTDYVGTVHFTMTDAMGRVPADFTIKSTMLGNYTFVNGVTFVTTGTWCVTATDVSDPDITGSQCDISAVTPNAGTPSHLKIITEPQFIATDGVSTPITIQLQDVDNNPAIFASTTPLYIYSDSTSTQLSLDGINFSAAPLATSIPTWVTSVNVYLKDVTIGAHHITVADDAILGQDFGLTNDTQTETTGVGEPYRFVIMPTMATSTAGEASGVLSIGMQDSLGNTVSATRNRQVMILPAAGTVATSTAGTWSDKLALDFSVGQSAAHFYYKQTQAGTFSLVGSETDPANGNEGIVDALAQLTVKAAAPAKIIFKNTEQELVAGQVSNVFSFGLLDQYDNPTVSSTDQPLYLTTNRSGSHFSTANNFATETQSVVMPAEAESANIYFKQTQYEPYVTITASDKSGSPDGAAGLLDATQIVSITPGALTKFNFSSLPSSVVAGEASLPFEISAINNYDVAIPFSSLRIYLHSTSLGNPVFATSSDLAHPVNYLDVAAGDLKAVFYYEDNKSNSFNVIASDEISGADSGIINASAPISVLPAAPDHFTFITDPQTLLAGQVSGLITLGLVDRFQNLTAAVSPLAISLTTNSSSGTLAASTGGPFNLETLTIPTNESAANFYYRDIASGTPKITASTSSLGSVSQTETINWGSGQTIHLSTTSSNLTAGAVSEPITISVANQYGISIPLDAAWDFSITSQHASSSINKTAQNSFTYSDTLIGTTTITASLNGLTAGTLSLNLQSAAMSQLVFVNEPRTIELGEKSETLKIQAQDQYGNLASLADNLILDLHTDSLAGHFVDVNGETITQITLPAAVPTAELFYQDSTVGPSVLSATNNSITGSQTISVINGPVRALRLATSPTTLTPNQISNVINLETLNAHGQVVPTITDLTVYLRATDGQGTFATSTSGPFNLTSLTIPTGTSSLPFYFKDATVGSLTVKSQLNKEQLVTVTNSNDHDLFDYTLAVNIDTQSLISAGALRADGNDLRFFDRDGVTNIPYWIESGLNSTSTRVWLKVPYLSRNSQRLIIMSYGDSNRAAASNQSAVFPNNDNYPTFTGWTNNTGWSDSSSKTSCGAINMYGGYNRFGAGSSAQKTYANLPAGQYQITFNYYQLDSWDGEAGRLTVDGNLAWQRHHTASGADVCGTSYGDSGLYYPPVTVTVNHAAGDLKLFFDSTLDEAANNESWGIDHITVRQVAPLDPMVTVSSESANLDLTITAGEPYRLAFSSPTTMSADGASGVMSAQILDEFGNITSFSSSSVINLSTSASTSGQFATSTSGTWGINNVVLDPGISAFAFYYRDPVAGTKTLSLTAANLLGAEKLINVTPGEITHFIFTSEPQTLAVLATSTAFKIQALDKNNNLVKPAALTLRLSSSSNKGEFSPSLSPWQGITTLDWPAGADTAAFYYKDRQTGTSTLSVIDSNLSYQAATQSVVLYSTSLSALKFASGAQTVVTGTPSAPVSLSLLDGAGNQVATDTPLTISLSSNSGTTEFSSALDNPNWQKNLNIIVAPGDMSTQFYFRDSVAGSITITAAAADFNNVSQNENVIVGTPDHLSVSSSGSTPAGTSMPIKIKILTADNRPVAVTSNTTLTLSSSPSGSFSLSNDNWQPVTTLNFAPGQVEQSLYFRSQIAGSAQLQATVRPYNSWTDGQNEVDVLPLNIYQLKVLSGPDTFNVHNASTVLVAQTQDQYGNVTALATSDTDGADSLPIYLYGPGQFATSTTGTWGISAVPLNLGESTFSFYYRSASLGSQTITVTEESTAPTTDTGWVNGSWNLKVLGDTAANIMFSSPSRSIKAGEYGEIIIQAVLADASPAILEKPLSIALSPLGASGNFSLSTSSPSAVTNINIPSGQSAVTFYAFNSQAGVYTITAAAAGYQPINQSLTVLAGTPSRMVFVNAPQTITAGQDSQSYHLQIQDAYGNVVALSANANIKLQASDAGTFSLASGNDWSATSTISLSTGTSDAYFYYRSHNIVGAYEVKATDASGQLSAGVQNAIIAAAPVNRLSILSAPFSVAKGQVSPAISLVFYDQYGNSRVLAAPISLYLYSTGQGSFSTSSNFAATTSVLTLSSGLSGASFYYRDKTNGTPTIIVSDQQPLDVPDSGLTNASQVETITEGVPASIQLSAPASTPAGAVTPLSLQLYNQYGEPTAATSSLTVYLDSSSLYGRFSTTTNFEPTDFITSYNFNAGQSTQTIYYRDTLSGAVTISAADARPLDNPDSGLLNSSAAISVLPADLYSFTFLSAPQTLEAGQPSSVLAIEARDVYGNVKAVPADTQVYFYSSSTKASFSTSSDFVATTTSATIRSGANGLNLYYRDYAAGTPTITASDQAVLDYPDSGLANAVQNVTITPGNIFRIKILSAPQTLEVGQTSASYTLELQNRYGAARAVNNDTTLYLASNSVSGQFAINQAGPYNVNSIIIPAGQSQANFYYRQLAAGSAILTVSDSSPADGSLGLLDDSQAVDMTVGPAVQLALAASPSQVVARHTSNAISVVLLNQSGYQTVSSSTMRLYFRSSSADGTSEFATSPQGPWGINYFDLAPNTSQFTLYYRSTQLGDQTITIADELPITNGVGLVNAIGTIKVIEQTLDHFLVTNIADPQIQGSPSTVIVMAKDAADFIFPQYQGRVCFSASDYYAILPGCYTFLPSDYGMVSLNNSVAFLHAGEKTVFATDENGITGMQNNITVVANNSGFLAKLKFSNTASSIALQRGQAYGPLTVQLFDDNDQPVNAPSGGYVVRLSASSASGQFALSANGPWSSTLQATIPAGLSSVNVYYKDSSSGEALIMASDWQSGVDDSHIVNANLTTVTSGLILNSTKKLEAHNAGTLAMTENKSLFINDSLLDTLEGQGSFDISVKDDVSGQGVPVSLELALINARGEVYQTNTASTTATGTYTYNISSIKAKVPDDSGDWNLDIKAQAADGRRGEIFVPVNVSGWRGVLNYSLGYVKQGSPLTVGVSLYNNGVLSDAPDFSVEWLDKSGHIVSGATPLTKTQMTRFQTGEYYGNLTTNSGLSEGEKYHALLIVKDTDSGILAEDSHGDIQISNNPAMAPKNFQVEKILTSTPPAPETYDLKFSWDASDKATSYSLYRTQDKFARLFSNPCTIAQVQSGARASGTCESLINMDEDPSDDTIHWVKEATLPFANITSYTLKDAQNLAGENYFFLVRASNGLQESGLSSMLFVAKHPFVYNSTAGATNYNWFSMPYNLTSFTNAAAGLVKAVLNKPSLIVADIEGGLGLNTNRKINAVALWDSLTQNITSVYRYRTNPFNKWTGVDFTVLPGAGMYLQSSGLTNPFTWTVLGADAKIVHNFSYNSSSSATNYNWVSLPYSGMYKKASDVVNDIEGGLGPDSDQKINVIALWDSSSQNINSIYRYRAKPFNKWTGIDFDIKPGDGIYLQTSGLTPSFSWTPALLVEPNQ